MNPVKSWFVGEPVLFWLTVVGAVLAVLTLPGDFTAEHLDRAMSKGLLVWMWYYLRSQS